MYFVDEKFWILIKISPKFVPKGKIDNNPALVQIMGQQAMMWTTADPIHRHIYTALITMTP